MPRYRKKPVVIEAFCLGIDPMPDWFCTARTQNAVVTHGTYDHLESASIHTLEGVMAVQRGDYVLQGVQGEIYSCKAAIFLATYEPAGEEPHA